jgi:probable HAF family extracellular repeat protein
MSSFSGNKSMPTDGHAAECAARRRALTRQLAFTLSLTLVCQSALAQAAYRIKPLGVLGGCTSSAPIALGFNGAGQVAGKACNAHGDTHAFLWKNNGTPMADLGPDQVGSTSEGVALNASGLVTGDAQDSTGEFVFLSSGDGTPMRRILDSLGGTAIYPLAINDLGQLTGYATLANGDKRAFVWKNDGSPMHDLHPLSGDGSIGYAINASGQVAGSWKSQAFVWKNDGTPILSLGTAGWVEGGAINAAGQVAVSTVLWTSGQLPTFGAFFWSNDGTPMQNLGTLGGKNTFFTALNDSGQVVGSSLTKTAHHAFAWMNDGTPMRDLGTFGGTYSGARDINSSGQVTGAADLAGDKISHAFLWRHDGTKIQDLNKLVDPGDPIRSYITLTSGDFINDRGDVLAEGTDSRTGLSGLYLLQGAVLTLSPRSLAFGNLLINKTSAAKSVTLTNTSDNVVAISSVALTGSAVGQFASTNNCGSSLVGHATCTIKVTFKPITKGAKSAFLKVNGGSNGLTSAKLTGTGT